MNNYIIDYWNELEAKYPMPEAFSKEIAAELSKLTPQKSVLSDIAEKSREKISAIKVGVSSALGGAVLTALGASLFFSLQTSVVTRGDMNEFVPGSIAEDAGWIVLDDLAIKITSLSTAKKGQAKNLMSGSKVKIDEEFMRFYRFITEMICYEQNIPIINNDFDSNVKLSVSILL